MTDKRLPAIVGVVILSVALLGGALYWCRTQRLPTVAVVDAQSVIEAKKLVLLAGIRRDERNVERMAQAVAESESIGQRMQTALATLSKRYGVMILDKKALLYAPEAIDLTAELYAEMATSPQEARAAREQLQKEVFRP